MTVDNILFLCLKNLAGKLFQFHSRDFTRKFRCT